MSSRDGCWPTSSSKGSMYSSTGPGNMCTCPKLKFGQNKNKTVWIKPDWSACGFTVGSGAPWCQLPQDEAKGVHIDAQKWITLEVDCALQDFGSHVTSCSHLQVPSRSPKISTEIIATWPPIKADPAKTLPNKCVFTALLWLSNFQKLKTSSFKWIPPGLLQKFLAYAATQRSLQLLSQSTNNKFLSKMDVGDYSEMNK